jgi:hypothetical protein
VSIVAFLSQPDPATAGVTVTPAVERFLDFVAAATTRAGYAETLIRLTAATIRSPPCSLSTTPR